LGKTEPAILCMLSGPMGLGMSHAIGLLVVLVVGFMALESFVAIKADRTPMAIAVKIAIVSFAVVLCIAAFHALFYSTRAERKVYRRSLLQVAPESSRALSEFTYMEGMVRNVARRVVPSRPSPTA
jgi:hypothetical protein